MNKSVQLYEPLDFGITRIDTGLGGPGIAACYLMESGEKAAIIETGTHHTVPDIIALIDKKSIARNNIEFVIVTHVHLDHAGGVGELMRLLPHATLLVHPRGARHMMNPQKLQAGAIAVYGEEKFFKEYGTLQPVDSQRVNSVEDGECITLGDRTLTFYDTPGHARHHVCIHDNKSNGIFTGDTLGVVYRQLCHGATSFVMPTTTPVQFDPEALCASIDRMMAIGADFFYLTHYGRVAVTEQHAVNLKKQVKAYAQLARDNAETENPEQKIFAALMAYTLDLLKDYGCPLSREKQIETIKMDLKLNTQGLLVWLQQRD